MAESPTTILLFGLPALLEDILIAAVGSHSEFRVLRCAVDAAGPMTTALREGASVVVVANDDPANLPDIDPLLARLAALPLLAFGVNGATACLHTLQLHATALDDVSAAQVISILSSVAGGGSA